MPCSSFATRRSKPLDQPPPGVFRIAVLGDSCAWGWRVPIEAVWPSLLEQYLNATLENTAADSDAAMGNTASTTSSLRYEVLNFAVPGYNTVMQAATLRSLASRFDPDAILIGFNTNDLILPHFVHRRPSLWTLHRSYLWDWLRGRKLNGIAGRIFASHLDVNGGRVQTEFDPDPASVEPEFRRFVGFANYERALAVFAQWRRHHCRPVIHLAFREFPFETVPWHEPDMPRKENDRLRRAQDAARQKGLAIVDSRDEQIGFLGRHPGVSNRCFWTGVTDTHPSRLGHIMLFKAVYRDLVENRRLPDADTRARRLKDDLRQWDAMADAILLKNSGKPAP